MEIPGQLNSSERELVTQTIQTAPNQVTTAIEVGTWLGGGSTIHILRALENSGRGHLWGIEADRSIYDRMISNIRTGAPDTIHRFTPLFGFSEEVLPKWLRDQENGFRIDFAFLDGGNNPMEQINEFRLITPFMPPGSILMAHDANMRKGRWLVPYLSALDNWQVQLHDVSEFGLLHARKIAPEPSSKSKRSADLRLLLRRLNPVEIAAWLLPAKVCAVALNLLPRAFARRLSDGR